MKLLFDLFPVILFFAAFKYSEKNPETAASWVASLLGSALVDVKQAPILLATVVVIAATVAQIAWVHFRHGKVDKMLWISLGLVVVFGGLTLAALATAELNAATIVIAAVSLFVCVAVVLALVGAVRNPPEE